MPCESSSLFPIAAPRRFLRLVAALAVAAAVWAQPVAQAQETPPAAGEGGRTEERMGNWTLRCISAADPATRRCEMVQVVGDTQSGRDVLAVAIGYPEGQPRPIAWIILPLGVLLPPGIGVKIDQGEVNGMPYRSCDTRGCATPWQLSEEDVGALKRGNELVVIFRDIEGKSLGIPVSLSGFTAAFDKLQ